MDIIGDHWRSLTLRDDAGDAETAADAAARASVAALADDDDDDDAGAAVFAGLSPSAISPDLPKSPLDLAGRSPSVAEGRSVSPT